MAKKQEAKTDKVEAKTSGGLPEDLMGFIVDKPWLERESYCRTKVKFGDRDHAILVLVSGTVLQEAEEVVTKLIGTDFRGLQDEEAARLFFSLFSGEESSIWRLIDEIEVRCVRSWDLAEWEEAIGRKVPCPRTIDDAAERLEMLCTFVPVFAMHWRILYGLVWMEKKV